MSSNLEARSSSPGDPGPDALTPPVPRVPLATALRRTIAGGYALADLRADMLAGVVVGIVALPLSMALAIAVGAPPQHGLYTAVVAGVVVAALGGCKFQVTGPTAAFVVILAPIVSAHGLTGLLTAGFMAGLLLVVMGAARLGRLVQFIPHPVTTGFTTGIAVVIAVLQVKDVFGLEVGPMPEHFTEKLAALWAARGSASGAELLVAVTTLGLLILVPRLLKKVPAPLVAIALVAAGAEIAHRLKPGFSVATIGTRFRTVVDGVEVAGIPSVLPSPSFPWGDGLSFALVSDLLPAALAIAVLGAIESLLSAVIADGMTGEEHDPDAELVGLGVGNLIAPIFGGIAATGALARTATSIRAGARSPLAAVTHALVVLLSILFFARFVAYVPMAALAALLLVVSWNMSELRGFVGVLRVAPKSDSLVLVTCFGLTVFFDMVMAVGVGVVLAALLFMRRMAELTESRSVLSVPREPGGATLPEGVAMYEINGPLFFGASQKAMAALHVIRSEAFSVMILHLGKVPVIDATGLVALENAIARLVRGKKKVVLAGPLPRPERTWEKARLAQKHQGVHVAPDLGAAVALAARLVDDAPGDAPLALPITEATGR